MTRKKKPRAKTPQPQRPMLMTGGVSALVVILFLVAPIIARWLTPAQMIDMSRSSHETTGGVRNMTRAHEDASYAGFDGEAARTERRLREVLLVTLAAYDRVVAGYLQGYVPRSVAEIVRDIDSSAIGEVGLAPLPDASGFASPFHQVFVRYHVERRAIEVLSLPATREDGPALLMRLPEVDASDVPQGRMRYFVADRHEKLVLPAAFASSPRVQAGGWSSALLDVQLPPEAAPDQLLDWARTQLTTEAAR